RQWQLHNIGNHRGDLPGSFLAIRATQGGPPLDEVRVLQARPAPKTGRLAATPLVDDDALPSWQEALASRYGFGRSTFRATYPSARVCLADDAVPLDVTVDAVNPMIPLNAEASSLPTVMLTVT